MANKPLILAGGNLSEGMIDMMSVSGLEILADPDIPHPTLALLFDSGLALDPRITFARASQATYVDALGRTQIAANNVPRLDYDPVTGVCRGLLMERAATNLIPESDDLSSETWTKGSGVTLTPDSDVLAPDGSEAMRADLSGVTGHEVWQSLAAPLSAGVSYTLSVWIRQGSGSFAFQLAYYDGGSVLNATTITTGSLDGWERVRFTFTPNTGEVALPRVRLIGFSNGGDGDSVYIWGAQLETGSTATSYIPTEGSPATRAEDQASVLDLTDWYNPEQGTLLVEFQSVAGAWRAGYNPLFAFGSSGTTNEWWRAAVFDPTDFRVYYASEGVNHTNVQFSTPLPDLTARLATAMDGTGWRASLDGAAVLSELGSPQPGVTRFDIASQFFPTQAGEFVIRKILYFPRRLADEQLQALTS